MTETPRVNRGIARGCCGCGMWSLAPFFGLIRLNLIPVTQSRWTFNLPDGGSITYQTQSPLMHFSFAPNGNHQYLAWQPPAGGRLAFPMGMGGHRTLQARIRGDHRALWLIDRDDQEIIATLDLDSAKFTGEDGIVYKSDGSQPGEDYPLPSWATLDGGKVLAEKSLY